MQMYVNISIIHLTNKNLLNKNFNSWNFLIYLRHLNSKTKKLHNNII